MKKLIGSAMLFCLMGCNGGGDAPQATAEQFWAAAQKNDTETGKKLVRKADVPQIKAEKQDEQFKDGVFTFGESKVEGSQATVPTTVDMDGKKFQFETVMVQEDGKWKVNLEKTGGNLMEAMLGISMEAMKKGFEKMGEQMGEEMKKAMEGVSEDMEKDMEKAMESAEEEETEGEN